MLGKKVQEPEPEVGIEKHKKNLAEYRNVVQGEIKTDSLEAAVGGFEAPRPGQKPKWVYTARLIAAVSLFSGALAYMGRGCIETSVDYFQAAPRTVSRLLAASASTPNAGPSIAEKAGPEDYVKLFGALSAEEQQSVATSIYDAMGKEQRMSLMRHMLSKKE